MMPTYRKLFTAAAALLLAASALAQSPMVQRQTPTHANQVAPAGKPAKPAPASPAQSAANRPGAGASQPAATGAATGTLGGKASLDAAAAGARVGGTGGAVQAQGGNTGGALPTNPFQQDTSARTGAGPGTGKAVTPADLSRETQLRQLSDPQGGFSATPNSAAAAAVGGKSAGGLVQGAGAVPQPGAGKNDVGRQAQQSVETSDATKEQVRNALFPQGLSGQTIESVVGGAYRALEKAAIESGISKKYNEGIPSAPAGVRGQPDPEGPVRPEGNPVPAVDAGRVPITAAEAAKKAQVTQPVDDQRRAVERMTPTPEARRDMVKPSDTRTNPADGRSGDGTTPSPGTAPPGGAPPPGGKAPEQVDQSRPGSKPGKKPDDPSGG